jgi:methylenetetrahydrofolate dehydrogenase (NADP+)/methenyltetrahydrofolate cyclohydrolase
MTLAAKANIIDGKQLAAQIREQVRLDTQKLASKNIKPGLAVILVGENPASAVYVKNKVAACEQAGFHSELQRHPDTLSEADLLKQIQDLNDNPQIHGILVQLPLPKHIDAHKVIETIAASKDVDGFHVSNAGLLMTGNPRFRPCTPYGIMKMLEAYNVSPWGAHACIVGASNIVGKPMAMLLLAAGATVTICNSKTRDLAHHTQHADILVVATGKPNMITGDMIKPGATVIDVGINRQTDGKLCGDVDFETAKTVAGAITPVPGGVGPMTIAMLLVNTLEAAERSLLA